MCLLAFERGLLSCHFSNSTFLSFFVQLIPDDLFEPKIFAKLRYIFHKLVMIVNFVSSDFFEQFRFELDQNFVERFLFHVILFIVLKAKNDPDLLLGELRSEED